MKIVSYSELPSTASTEEALVLGSTRKKLESHPLTKPVHQTSEKVFRIVLAILLAPIWAVLWAYKNIKIYLRNQKIYTFSTPQKALPDSSKTPSKPVLLEKKPTPQEENKTPIKAASIEKTTKKSSRVKKVVIGAVAIGSLALLSGWVFYHIKNGNISRILCQAKVIWDWDIAKNRKSTFGCLLSTSARMAEEDRCLGYEPFDPFVNKTSYIPTHATGYRPIPPQPGIF